jgi:glycosyltransferase involved in cell wall biosynthesis
MLGAQEIVLGEWPSAAGLQERLVMQRMPAISVLMAVRNGARFLDDALASLADQEFRDFEIILVDNGSLDATSSIIKEWAKREPRLRSFRLERPGLARSLGFAVSMARAPFLARLDSDDVAMPSRLGVQYALMQERPSLGMLGTFVELIDSEGRRIGERRLPIADHELKLFLRSGNPFVHSTVMMRRDAYERAGGYRTGLRLCEDFDLWCRMAEVTELANLDAPLVRYRLHGAGMAFRQAIRVAVVDACIIAAQRARYRGDPEPFDRGVPNLRRALALLDIARGDFLYRALKTTTAAMRLALEFGEHDQARQLRRRAYRLLAALPPGKSMLGGAGHIVASYCRPHSRQRRQSFGARLLDIRALAGFRKIS